MDVAAEGRLLNGHASSIYHTPCSYRQLKDDRATLSPAFVPYQTRLLRDTMSRLHL